MKRPTLLVPLVAILFSSCTSMLKVAYLFEPDSPRTEFKGKVRNLDYPGQIEEVEYDISAKASLRLRAGGRLRMWYFHEPDITLYLSLPDHHRTAYTTETKGVAVKVIKGRFDWVFSGDVQSDLTNRLRARRGVGLAGNIRVCLSEGGVITGFDIDLASEGHNGLVFRGIVKAEGGKLMQFPGTQRWHKKPDSD